MGPMAFLTEATQNVIYPLAALQGIAIAIMLNTGTSMISDMIDQDTANSSVVYGFYSLFEKIANGVIVFFLVSAYSKNEGALRLIMSVLPTICALFCFVFAWLGNLLFSDRVAQMIADKEKKAAQIKELKANPPVASMAGRHFAKANEAKQAKIAEMADAPASVASSHFNKKTEVKRKTREPEIMKTNHLTNHSDDSGDDGGDDKCDSSSAVNL